MHTAYYVNYIKVSSSMVLNQSIFVDPSGFPTSSQLLSHIMKDIFVLFFNCSCQIWDIAHGRQVPYYIAISLALLNDKAEKLIIL